MSVSKATQQRTLRALLPASALGLLIFTACVDDGPGITDDESAGAGGAEVSKAGSGNVSVAGTSADAGGAPSGVSGSGQAGSAVTPVGGGTGGSDGVDVGGAPANVGEGGQMNGQAGHGEGGANTTPVAMSCIFHTDAPAGDPGAGGAPPAANVVLQTSAFVGSYLTDTAGRTLYTYGADRPGDCQTPPASGCVTTCLESWPIFDAGSRVLGAGLDDAAFGSIDRGDGTWQTTYYGWPLYYYKSDLTLGQFSGQGKGGKTWHAAELTPPSVMIMKAGDAKYLADAMGRTLYVSAADQAGTEQADPVSACEGDCLATFKPFRDKHLSVVTSLDQAQFIVFVRKGAGGLQVAYKGLPLYTATTDLKSGDTTGLSTPGFTAAVL